MGKVSVLDCTLRDGGYCNQWRFGSGNIKRIVEGLTEAGIDIVECGFLTDRVVYDEDVTKYTTMEEASKVMPKDRAGRIYVCMVNYGEYRLSEIPENDRSSVDGIRVAFHKKDMEEALCFCEGIQKKGYKVFVQAMVSLSYSDEEFLGLMKRVNRFKPYAFYIVDSFGMMKRKELVRLFYMVEHNLADGIMIGFHSHNNMQLSYSNAQALVDIGTQREMVIDSSVFGMGRGAGNLNTELFVEYLNDNIGAAYDSKPLLNIIDGILTQFYQENYWGYSLSNYLSAKYNAHPNYASYLDDKKTLTVEDIDEIFAMMDDDKKAEFDKGYIGNLYVRYMARGMVHEEHEQELRKMLTGKKVLLVAPGKSAVDEGEKIKEFSARSDVVSIGINSDRYCPYVDFIFLSNLRRFKELDKDKKGKCIVTSNIPGDNVYLQTGYRKLLNTVECVQDNAGLMAIRLLASYGVTEIWLAGFDGYSHDVGENYGDSHMVFITTNAMLDAINAGMEEVLTGYSKQMKICFLTKPRHIRMIT